MTTFILILLTTIFVSLISLIGIATLFLKEKILEKILPFLVSFSAGGLLGGAFLHLLPEAINEAEGGSLFNIFLYLISGFCLFYVLEEFIGWHHHHSTSHPEISSFSYLILISDALHNFIDGIVIAGSFMASFSMGLITGLAIVLHEIPQEIGDFAVLIFGGIRKTRALFLNFISALAAILGGIIGFFFIKATGEGIFFLLPFTAGGFIYIAASDLIPQVKQKGKSGVNFLTFLAGIIIMMMIKIWMKIG